MKNWINNNIPLAKPLPRKEELANGISHLLGALACLPGSFFLLRAALQSANNWHVPSSTVFMLSMFLLYASSSVYHLLADDFAKRIGRIFDHAAIYILIAGTYTPVAFGVWEPWGVVILSLVWGVALVGFVLKLLFWGRFKLLHMAVYLGMGWVIVFFWPVVTRELPAEFLRWALAGGSAYTLGVIFYAMKNKPFTHLVWHFFVLSGSVIFYFGILRHIVV